MNFQEDTSMQKNILILGVGNLLLSDEGAGVHAVNYLQQHYDIPAGIEVIDGGTAGMELLSYILQANHLILLDAVNSGHAPGTLIRLDDAQVPNFFATKMSPHQIGLTDILAAATLSGGSPDHITLLGVEPASFELGMDLSPVVAPIIPQMIAIVLSELEILGFELQPRQHKSIKF
ncbi:MAG: HyaD/HybD family hydrogenase maturation endopeptidase [Thiotrichaceae bacterium]